MRSVCRQSGVRHIKLARRGRSPLWDPRHPTRDGGAGELGVHTSAQATGAQCWKLFHHWHQRWASPSGGMPQLGRKCDLCNPGSSFHCFIPYICFTDPVPSYARKKSCTPFNHFRLGLKQFMQLYLIFCGNIQQIHFQCNISLSN